MAEQKWLDKDGVLYLWGKIKELVNANKVTKTSQLTNDSGFLTEHQDISGLLTIASFNSQMQNYDQNVTQRITDKVNDFGHTVDALIAQQLKDITSFSFEVVTALPETGVAGTIYLIADAHGTDDQYDEYIWVTDKFEKLGHTDITIDAITNDEINEICK